jgi:hypothetical protein
VWEILIVIMAWDLIIMANQLNDLSNEK